jgi:hypothetical protein
VVVSQSVQRRAAVTVETPPVETPPADTSITADPPAATEGPNGVPLPSKTPPGPPPPPPVPVPPLPTYPS